MKIQYIIWGMIEGRGDVNDEEDRKGQMQPVLHLFFGFGRTLIPNDGLCGLF